MTFQEKWNNILEFKSLTYERGIKASFIMEINQKSILSRLANNEKILGLDYYINGNCNEIRNRFSFSTQILEFLFIKYNNNWPYWNMKPYTYALLSDHKGLIDRYANLPVDTHLLYDDPKKGMPKHFNYAFQGLLKEDSKLIQRGLDLFEEDIDKRKEIRWMRAHIACTKAVASGDLLAIKKALLLFEDKRIKSQAIKADICEEVLSFFPLAYAKIAWIKGIEVDTGSKFMPIELLEVKPLEEYTIPYWFLRDFYRELGINWCYDPIHPELQDWENDSEFTST